MVVRKPPVKQGERPGAACRPRKSEAKRRWAAGYPGQGCGRDDPPTTVQPRKRS